MRLAAAVFALLLLTGTAHAAPTLTGKWVADLDTQDATETIDIYAVANGQYRCRSCTPPRSYAADGQPHPVPGDADVISESVAVVSPRSIITRIVSPTRVRETTMTVAPDDLTATYVSIDHRTDLPGELRTEYLARRIAPAPAGANQVSGSWRGVKYVSVPEIIRTVELVDDGRKLIYREPGGFHFTSNYDGPPTEVEHGKGMISRVRVQRTGDRSVKEIWLHGSKITEVRTYALSADGRSLEIATTDALTGVTFRGTSRRR